MNKLITLISQIYVTRTRLTIAVFFYCVIWGLMVVLTGLASNKFLNQYISGGYVDLSPILSVLLFIGELGYCFLQIENFVNGKEIFFFAKMGVNNWGMYVFYLFKLRWNFVIFSSIYSLLYFCGTETLSWMNCIFCFAGAFMLFACIGLAVSLYCAFLYKNTGPIINYILCIILVVGVILAMYFELGNMDLFSADILRIIAENKYFAAMVRYIIMPGFIQTALFCIILLPVVVLLIRHFVFFEITASPRGRIKNIDLEKKRNYSKQYPLKRFLLRDIKFICRSILFLLIQGFFVFASIIFLYYDYADASKVGFLASVAFNALFTQEFFKLDAGFIDIYMKLPLHYGQYLFYRVFGAFTIGYSVPCVLFLIFAIFQKMHIGAFCFYLLIAAILGFAIVVYFSSIILYFFPQITKTDIPLVIGTFLPFLFIVAIPVGISKGKRQWKKWRTYA